MTDGLAIPHLSTASAIITKSDLSKALSDVMKIITELAYESANKLMAICDRENMEMARQGLSLDFDADDISTEEYMRVMKQREDIQNRFQNEKTQLTQQYKRQEDFYKQEQEKLQNRYDVACADLETWQEKKRNFSAEYFEV